MRKLIDKLTDKAAPRATGKASNVVARCVPNGCGIGQAAWRPTSTTPSAFVLCC